VRARRTAIPTAGRHASTNSSGASSAKSRSTEPECATTTTTAATTMTRAASPTPVRIRTVLPTGGGDQCRRRFVEQLVQVLAAGHAEADLPAVALAAH